VFVIGQVTNIFNPCRPTPQYTHFPFIPQLPPPKNTGRKFLPRKKLERKFLWGSFGVFPDGDFQLFAEKITTWKRHCQSMSENFAVRWIGGHSPPTSALEHSIRKSPSGD
jgi:hypothetical protein